MIRRAREKHAGLGFVNLVSQNLYLPRFPLPTWSWVVLRQKWRKWWRAAVIVSHHALMLSWSQNFLLLCSVQFSHSVVPDSLQPHGLQHSRPPCLSPTPGVYSHSSPLSWWCHPTISSSVVPFSSHLQSFPASGSFQMSQLFPSGGQSIWVSASISVLPMNIQDWSPLGWIGWISLLSKGLFKSLLQHHSLKASILRHSVFFIVQLSHPYMTTGKTIALTRWTFVGKVMSLL